MKTITALFALWVIISPVMAQKQTEKHISFSGKDNLILNIQIADSILVHTWTKPEVYAKASVNINDNADNEAYEIFFDDNGKDIKISANFEKDYFKGRKNCCMESMITWDLFIPENTGFSVETINGNITIDGATAGIKVKSISGFIDLAVSHDRHADLELKTITGTFYTDLDLKPDKMKSPVPQIISQKLNNGGYPVSLETISGDIYVRKSK